MRGARESRSAWQVMDGPRFASMVDEAPPKGNDADVSIAQIEEAVQRGQPFVLKVADGDEFRVPHPDYIFLPPAASAKRTYVMVHNDAGFASILPLLTITNLTFQVDAGGSK